MKRLLLPILLIAIVLIPPGAVRRHRGHHEIGLLRHGVEYYRSGDLRDRR